MLLVIRRWLILIVGGKGRSLRLQGLLIVVGGLSLDCEDKVWSSKREKTVAVERKL